MAARDVGSASAPEVRQSLLVAFMGRFRLVRAYPLELSLAGPRPLPDVVAELCARFGPSFAELASSSEALIIHNNRPVDRTSQPQTSVGPGDELVFALGLGLRDGARGA